MNLSLRLTLSLTLLALPLVEIALLIKLSGILGVLPVVGIVIGTAVAGGLVIRSAGLSALSRLFAEVQSGGSPMLPLMDQFIRVTAGTLLILPGLLGDCIGGLLLIPVFRQLVLKSLRSLFSFERVARADRTDYSHGSRRPDAGERFHKAGRREETVTIIEGEYERLDDNDPPRPQPARKP